MLAAFPLRIFLVNVSKSTESCGVFFPFTKRSLTENFIFLLNVYGENIVFLLCISDENILVKDLDVKLVNTYPLPIDIDWYADGMKRFYTIQPNESASLKDMIRCLANEKTTVTFQAWDMKNKNLVLINNRKIFNVPLLASGDEIKEDIRLTKGFYKH